MSAVLNAIGGTPASRQGERDEIDRLTAEFLARGGKVEAYKQEEFVPEPWMGTRYMGKRLLVSATKLARESDTSPQELVVRSRRPGAPKSYMFLGDVHFEREGATTWARGIHHDSAGTAE